MTTELSEAGHRIMRLPKHSYGKPGETEIIDLKIGEPSFATPPSITEAAIFAMRGGATHYGDLDGDPDLRAHIAGEFSRRSGENFTAEQVVITAGSTSGLASALTVLVNPGDRVLLLDPTYGAYAEMIALIGAEPVRVPFRADGHLNLSAVQEAAATAKLMILCHPSSPTGVVFTPLELSALGDVLADTGTLLLADEAYADIVYDGTEFHSTVETASLRPRVIVSRTFSKGYAMTGWRLGYLVVPSRLAEAVRTVYQTSNLTANSAVQKAGLAALREGPAVIAPMVDAYARRRDLVMDWVRDTGLVSARVPEATLYVFARYPQDMSSTEMVRHLLSYGVRVQAGVDDGPGGENHLRICFAADVPAVTEGLRRLEKGLSAL
ncbi:pyridoxal phosphate-dependent aminotransferase [Streptomyces sp. NPDC051014]|uniref:pyridoxal phosphate-dependent aminotransferase n=1 Tax=Streptomyces sp. NPDC051014 TaxID=3155751 RepID=UPI0034021572